MSGGAHKLMGVVLGGMIISVVEPTFPVAGLILGMSVLGELARILIRSIVQLALESQSYQKLLIESLVTVVCFILHYF